MSLFGDLFGGFFDFNNDGKVSLDEELIGLSILNEISKENDDMTFAFDDDCDDIIGICALSELENDEDDIMYDFDNDYDSFDDCGDFDF